MISLAVLVVDYSVGLSLWSILESCDCGFCERHTQGQMILFTHCAQSRNSARWLRSRNCSYCCSISKWTGSLSDKTSDVKSCWKNISITSMEREQWDNNCEEYFSPVLIKRERSFNYFQFASESISSFWRISCWNSFIEWPMSSLVLWRLQNKVDSTRDMEEVLFDAKWESSISIVANDASFLFI